MPSPDQEKRHSGPRQDPEAPVLDLRARRADPGDPDPGFRRLRQPGGKRQLHRRALLQADPDRPHRRCRADLPSLGGAAFHGEHKEKSGRGAAGKFLGRSPAAGLCHDRRLVLHRDHGAGGLHAGIFPLNPTQELHQHGLGYEMQEMLI